MAVLNKRQLQREGTLGLIYETVNQLVKEKGFDSMRIKDICERAGISTGAFYHHFASKQDILYERYKATNKLVQALYEDAQDLEAREGVCYMVCELAEYTRSRVPDMLKSYTEASIRHKAEWRARSGGLSFGDAVRALLEAGIQSGRLSAEVDAAATAALLVAFQRGITLEQCMSDGAFLAENRPEEQVCRWIRALP